jgi:hypothetical protein
VEEGDFFSEVPKIWVKYKWVWAICFLLILLQIYLAIFAAPMDRIWSITANLPLLWLIVMHIVSPLILNPNAYPSEWHSDVKPQVKRLVAWLKRVFQVVKEKLTRVERKYILLEQ